MITEAARLQSLITVLCLMFRVIPVKDLKASVKWLMFACKMVDG